MTAPPDIAYGRVVGRFVSFATDSIGDPDTVPDEVLLTGEVVFTPRAHFLQLPAAVPPRLAVAQQVTGRVISGDLCPPDSIDPGLWLLATDQPTGQPTTIQWRASFRLAGISSQPPDIVFDVPAGGEVDLTQIVGLPPEPGVLVVVSHQDALDAAASADAAAASADAAAASADAAANVVADIADDVTQSADNASAAAASAAAASADADTADAAALTAAQHMDAAALSASQAATSAVVSGNNATAASTSANQASSKALEAAASATDASTANVNAQNAASAAITAQNAASASAVTANTAADTAFSQANSATTSATNAATSATNALNSAGAAANSAANAAAPTNTMVMNAISATTQTAPITTNQCPNPSLTTDANNWGTSGYGTAGVGSSARVPGAGEGGSPAWVATWTTGSTGGGPNSGPNIGPYGAGCRVPAAPSDVWSAAVFVKATAVVKAFIQVMCYDAGGVYLGNGANGTTITLAVGVSTQLTKLAAPMLANTATVAISVRVDNLSALGAGSLTVSRAQLIKGSTLPATGYRDGTFADSSWVGTPGASATTTVSVDIPAVVNQTMLDQSNGSVKLPTVRGLSAGGRAVTNVCGNPSMSIDGTGWTTPSFGTGGAGTAARVAGAGHGGSAGWVSTWTTAATDVTTNNGPNTGPYGAPARYAATTEQVWCGSVYVYTSVATSITPCLMWHNAAGTFIGQTLGPVTALAAGETRRLFLTGLSTFAGTAFVSMAVKPYQVQDFGASGSFTLSKVMLTVGRDLWPYRDGDSGDGRWTSTTGLSPSTAGIQGRTGMICCWGDSHTQLAHGGGNPYPAMLGQALGRQAVNAGRGGETSSGIALRQGGMDCYLTVAGNQIPAGTTAVAVTPRLTSAVFRDDAAWNFTGSINGVPGTLARAITTGAWTFTRSFAGNAVTVNPETQFYSFGVFDFADLHMVFVGSNLPNQAAVLRDVQSITNRIRDFGGKFLVVSVMNTATEFAGGGGANDLVTGINNQLIATYGALYLDLRGFLMRNGLALAGITPTAADTTAIAGNTIPPSLTFDNIHLNPAGRAVEVGYYAQVITARALVG